MLSRIGTKLDRLKTGLIAAVGILLLLMGLFSGLYLQNQFEVSDLKSEVGSLQAAIQQLQNQISSLQAQLSALPSESTVNMTSFAPIPSEYLTSSSQNVSVTINGLTCPMPTPEPQILYTLVPQIVRDSRFLNLTMGDMYSFGNGEEIGPGFQTVGNVTRQLPFMMEVVFYDYNDTAFCGPPSLNPPRISDLFVHIPYENGGFNWTDATFNLLLFFPPAAFRYVQYNQSVTFNDATQEWTVTLDGSLQGDQTWQVVGMQVLAENGTTSVISVENSSWSWASPIGSSPLPPPLSLKYGDTFELSLTLKPSQGLSHGELVMLVFMSSDSRRTIGLPSVLP